MDWLIRLNDNVFPFSLVGFILAVLGIPGVVLGWIQIWEPLKLFARRAKNVLDYVVSRFVPEYRAAFYTRQVDRLQDTLADLQNFAHQQEMECLSRIFSRLSFAGLLFMYLVYCVGLSAGLVTLSALSILEREILKLPVQKLSPGPSVGTYLWVTLLAALASGVMVLLIDIAAEASKLSPSFRKKRIDWARKKLNKVQTNLQKSGARLFQ